MNINEHERLSNITLRQKLKEQLVERKDMNVNEHERLSNITLRHKLKEQLVERKDMDINEHERLSNISKHLKMRAKQQHVCKEMDQYMINTNRKWILSFGNRSEVEEIAV